MTFYKKQRIIYQETKTVYLKKWGNKMKKEDILKAAKELFSVYGYKKVSMNEIAEKANVTKKTIYSYFKDKEDLFKQILSNEMENMKTIIEKNEKKDIPYFERIHYAIYELTKYKNENKFLLRVVKDSEIINNIHAKESLKIFDNTVIEYIKEKLKNAIENKQIKKCNVDIAAFVIYKVYIALMYEWSDENKPLNEQEVADNITAILKTGIFM